MNKLKEFLPTIVLGLIIVITAVVTNISLKNGNLGVAIPDIVAVFETSLATKITSSQTTMTLVSGTTGDSTTLSGTYGFVIDEGASDEEFVIATCADTACTSMTRGVSVTTGTTSVTALKKAHRRGASVKITNHPTLMTIVQILNGRDELPAKLKYDSLTIIATDSGNTLINKTYADGLVFAGFSTSTESTAGGGFLATQLQMASSSYSAVSPRLLYSRYSTSSPDVRGLYNPVTENDGYLNQGWLDLTEDFTFTGEASVTGTSTLSGDVISDTNVLAFTASTTITGKTLPQPVYIATSTTQTAGGILVCDANATTTLDFIGFAITSASANETVYIQTDGVVDGFTGLTNGAKYYVQDAVGTIGTSVGTFEVLVGTAISATEIFIQHGFNEYMGSVKVANNSSVGIPPNARMLVVIGLVVDGDIDARIFGVMHKNGITQNQLGITAGDTGVGATVVETVLTWSGNTLTVNNEDLSGNATIYIYR